ncbi:MAG: DUF3089 domain-containing protein [Myxococcota bacterium]
MSRAWIAIAGLVLVAVGVGARHEALLLAALDPGGSFDASRVPAPPDYTDPAFWTARPGRPGAADATPIGLTAADPSRTAVDVFYVHPTTHVGAGWNGAVDDAALNEQTDTLATKIQASAFNGCCAVYGPRYRQAHGHAFLRPGPDADAAIALAYQDVRAAFRHFLAHDSRGRPFVLAGHSQGALLGARLLREEIVAAGLGERLVAAYLIGAPLAPEPGVPLCAAEDQTRCLVTWNARGPRFEANAFELRFEGTPLCVNPLSWRADDALAAADRNPGAVFLHAGDGAPLPGFADARCDAGRLRVTLFGTPARDPMSQVLDFVMGPENYHPIEYQLFYLSLRRNAGLRAAAWLRENGATPAL